MMELSTKGRYAARMMVQLAVHHGADPMPKKELAAEEEISADYAEQILMKLKSAGLVVSHRGVHGGFTLGRKPPDITLKDILEATEGRIGLAPCRQSDCTRAADCVLRTVWSDLGDTIEKALDDASLDKLARQARRNQAAAPLSYNI